MKMTLSQDIKMKSFIIGSISGLASTLCSYPLTKMKNIMNKDRSVGIIKFTNLMDKISKRGSFTLYKGIGNAIVKSMPLHGSIIFG